MSSLLFSVAASAQAVDDNVTTNQNTAVDIYVIFNDFTSSGLAQETLQLNTFPNNGTVVVIDAGTPNDMTDDYVTYTPNAGFNGVDSFMYQITDIEMVTSTATVYITVVPPTTGGDPPVASDDMAVTSQGTPVTIAVVSNDSFGDGPGLGRISIVVNPSGGSAFVNDNGTPNDPTDDSITYSPEPNFTGNDLFLYSIMDYNGDTSTATVTIEVMPDGPGEGPFATDDFVTTVEDLGETINVLANDSFGSAGPGAGPIIVSPRKC